MDNRPGDRTDPRLFNGHFLYAIYVVDDAQCLIGYLKLHDLLLRPAEVLVSEVMRSDVVTATADHEELVRVADREHLPVVPDTDQAGRLIGLVSAEELRAIDRKEASEDIKALANVPRIRNLMTHHCKSSLDAFPGSRVRWSVRWALG